MQHKEDKHYTTNLITAPAMTGTLQEVCRKEKLQKRLNILAVGYGFIMDIICKRLLSLCFLITLHELCFFCIVTKCDCLGMVINKYLF